MDENEEVVEEIDDQDGESDGETESVDIQPEQPQPEQGEPAAPVAKCLKVVITVYDDKVYVGIQRTGCDPVFKNMAGGLEDTLAAIPGMVKEAETLWLTAPLYPVCPEKFEPPKPVYQAAAKVKAKDQPSLF